MSPWALSLHLPALTDDLAEGVSLAHAAGFHTLDVAASDDRPHEELELLADSGLLIGAAVLDAVDAAALVRADTVVRRRAVEALKRQIEDAALLGARLVLLDAPLISSEAERLCVAEACRLLANHAAGRMMPCVVPLERAAGFTPALFPARLLLGVRGPNHGAVREAGARLGHVLLDALPDAVLEAALRAVDYRGVVSLTIEG